MIRRLLPLPALVMLAGCSGPQSVLASMGEEAARIEHLALILFFGATVILLAVVLVCGLGLRGPASARRLLASTPAVITGGIAVPVVVLTALLAYGTWVMRENIVSSGEPAHRIEVTGYQWWWRVSYLSPDGASIASANEIRIPTGRDVEFTVKTADVIHSFWIPNLGGKIDMIPGRTNLLRLRADQEGIYRGQCVEFCGGVHALMAFEVIAMEPERYDAWLASLALPAPEPSEENAIRGRMLFTAAGCGSCHAVRGTPATGSAGPDLTRVGERRYIAAATLPTTRANIANFIVNGQHIKPGNAMPPFRIFSPVELDAVSTYLAGLK